MIMDGIFTGIATLFFSIFYLLLFPYLSIPNILFSSNLVRLLKNSKKHKKLRFIPVLFPIGGILFYLTIDLFEARNLYALWFAILSIISLAPALLYLFLHRRKL